MTFHSPYCLYRLVANTVMTAKVVIMEFPSPLYITPSTDKNVCVTFIPSQTRMSVLRFFQIKKYDKD